MLLSCHMADVMTALLPGASCVPRMFPTACLRHTGISWHGPCRYALAQQNKTHSRFDLLKCVLFC